MYLATFYAQTGYTPEKGTNHTPGASPAIGEPRIVPDFGLKLARYIWILSTCLLIASICFRLIFSQSEGPHTHAHCCFVSAFVASRPSAAIIMSQFRSYGSHTRMCADFPFFFFGVYHVQSVDMMLHPVVVPHRRHRRQAVRLTPRRGGLSFRGAFYDRGSP